MRREARHELEALRVTTAPVTRPVEMLSGGQRQVVALARSAVRVTARGQGALLLDEPTAALGMRRPGRWRTSSAAWPSAAIAVVVVTHNLPLCFAVADRIVVLNRGRKVADVATHETDNDAVVGWITGAKAPQAGLERVGVSRMLMRLLGLSAGAADDGSADIAAQGGAARSRGGRRAGRDGPPRRPRAHHRAGCRASDDADWFWDRLMESDGLIVSSPIYSRTIPGLLRLLGDKISGPQSDVAFTSELLRLRAEGAPIAVDFAIDERVLRPRVAGFIAVGGSLPPRWKTLALPLMHTLTASAQIAVVDQVEFAGAGSPASIVLQPQALERARRLGGNVGAQLGRAYDEAEYLGDPGACPLCHLSVIALRGATAECATCGAVGLLRAGDDGARVRAHARRSPPIDPVARREARPLRRGPGDRRASTRRCAT